MKKQLVGVSLASILVLLIVTFSSTQSTEAASSSSYYGHDGSVDEYMTKKIIRPYDKPNQWLYMVEICATDRPLSVSSVTLKSDMDEKYSSGFKTIRAGDCTVAGAVMKAKDSSTLGASMLEKQEAIQRIHEIVEGDNKNMSKAEKSELSRLQFITGIYRIP